MIKRRLCRGLIYGFVRNVLLTCFRYVGRQRAGVSITLFGRRRARTAVRPPALQAAGLLILASCGEVLTDQTMKLLVALDVSRTGPVVAIEEVQIVGNCPIGRPKLQDGEVCREFRIEQHEAGAGFDSRSGPGSILVWFGKVDGIWKVEGRTQSLAHGSGAPARNAPASRQDNYHKGAL